MINHRNYYLGALTYCLSHPTEPQDEIVAAENPTEGFRQKERKMEVDEELPWKFGEMVDYYASSKGETESYRYDGSDLETAVSPSDNVALGLLQARNQEFETSNSSSELQRQQQQSNAEGESLVPSENPSTIILPPPPATSPPPLAREQHVSQTSLNNQNQSVAPSSQTEFQQQEQQQQQQQPETSPSESHEAQRVQLPSSPPRSTTLDRNNPFSQSLSNPNSASSSPSMRKSKSLNVFKSSSTFHSNNNGFPPPLSTTMTSGANLMSKLKQTVGGVRKRPTLPALSLSANHQASSTITTGGDASKEEKAGQVPVNIIGTPKRDDMNEESGKEAGSEGQNVVGGVLSAPPAVAPWASPRMLQQQPQLIPNLHVHLQSMMSEEEKLKFDECVRRVEEVLEEVGHELIRC
jgi:hypothetical protein